MDESPRPITTTHNNDSVLREFDPLARTSPASDQTAISTTTSASSVVSDVQTGTTVTHLISPSLCHAAETSPSPSVRVTLNSTGLSPFRPKSRHTPLASPARLSPWLHHSILEQALGGFNRSPEWPSSPISHAREAADSMSKNSTFAPSSPSLADNSAVLNSLTSLLNRVKLQDASNAQSFTDKTEAYQDSQQLNMLSSRLGETKAAMAENSQSSAPPASEKSCTEPQAPSPYSIVEQSVAHSTPDQKSQPTGASRISIRGLSEMVSNMAHSIIDRIENVSRLSGAFIRSTQSNNLSTVIQSGGDPSFSVSSDPNHSGQVTEEDVWESVNSLRDTTDANRGFDFCSSGMENKENIPISEPSQQQQANAQFGGEHGSGSVQLVPGLSAANLAEEWSSLNDEVHNLRTTADSLSRTIALYEESLIAFEASEQERGKSSVANIFRIAKERDEAIEQAATMYRAYEDMQRRLHRAQETIELKKKDLTANTELLNSSAQTYQTVVKRMQEKRDWFNERLTDAIRQQEQARESNDRRLDKLKMDIRQYELKNSALSKQIEQLQQCSGELEKMIDQFLV